MRIIVHRGINQIGGCITEIATDQARIFIDLGQNLPDGEGNIHDALANAPTIELLTKGVDAIFYTHYHGDHMGLFHLVPDTTQQYIGSVAQRVAQCKHQRLSHIKGRETLSNIEIEKLEKMRTFHANQKIKVGDMQVTPYFVSHSACDAFMFLIEANGIRVLHTGDFRGHGYLSKGLLPTIQSYILKQGPIDFLITEGTMLSRLDEQLQSEYELQREVKKRMKRYKNVFVMCSSTDMERLATFRAANSAMERRPFVCDDFQKDILEIFTEAHQTHSPLFDFGNPYQFREDNVKLLNWMQEQGFCMLVRATPKFEDYLSQLESRINPDETILIYSMWKEYINPDSKHVNTRYLNFTKRFQTVKSIHTSGHASSECLVKVCNLVNPRLGIIPIHSEVSGNYANLAIDDALKSRIITKCKVVNGVEVVC